MEDFFKSVVNTGVPRTVLSPASNKGCAVNEAIDSSIRDQTSNPSQNVEKGQCFLYHDG